VLKGVLSSEDVEDAKAMLWKDLTSQSEISCTDASTWGGLKIPEHGLMGNLAQSAGAWFVRGMPSVKKVFEHIWGTSDLIVSMDCVIVWKPWWLNDKWRPRTEGLHLDQNPFNKPDLECVQGMVPLLPVTAATGGLEVVPRSHTPESQREWKREFSRFEGRGDWCPMYRVSVSNIISQSESIIPQWYTLTGRPIESACARGCWGSHLVGFTHRAWRAGGFGASRHCCCCR
jgi:hypothetical protein